MVLNVVLNLVLNSISNYVCSEFQEIISGVPQGSIVGLVLFNAFLNNFFCTTEITSVHNFADYNTLSVFAKTIRELVHSSKSDCHLPKKFVLFASMNAL